EFPNGKFPAGGKSDIESIFPPPYFEWFQFDKDFTEYTNLDECISYLTEYIIANGPFDGFLGFSQLIWFSGQYGPLTEDTLMYSFAISTHAMRQ
ncbi:dihydrofolate reductase-like protein, partial [Trifolium pratense]